MRRKNPRGFTLIELLVVITIITLLISILLPALSAARKAAQSIACASNMRQIDLAAHVYTQDNDGRFPYAGIFVDPKLRTFFGALAPYLGVKWNPAHHYQSPYLEHSVFRCPGDGKQRASTRKTYHLGGACSYSVNGWVTEIYDTAGDGNSIFGINNVRAHLPLRVDQIRQASNTLLIQENRKHDNVYGWFTSATVNIERVNMTYAYTGANALYADDLGKQGYHSGANNWAFVDGHVQSMNWSNTIAPRNLWRVTPADKGPYTPGASFVK